MQAEGWAVVTAVLVEDNVLDRVFTLGLAESSHDSSRHLVVQISLDAPTTQDISTGMDTYCIMDDLGGIQYGGVRRVELDKTTLHINFTEEAADELTLLGRNLVLELQIGARDLDRLRYGARRVFTYGNLGQQPELLGI